jgi:hypothetical protein
MSVVSIVLTTLFVTAFVLWIGANLATTEKRLLYRPRRLYTSGDADFRRALGILLGPPLIAGNHVTTLINGVQIYPAMLNAIRTAHTNITFETFVFRDTIGVTFIEELSAAAGVACRSTCCSTGWDRARWIPRSSQRPAARAAMCRSITHPPGTTWAGSTTAPTARSS